MMKRLHDLIVEYRKLDDRFFYWWKAQSPVEVEALGVKLKACALAFAFLSTTFVYFHSKAVHRAEREAMRTHELKLVEVRKLRKAEQQKSNQQPNRVVMRPMATIDQ